MKPVRRRLRPVGLLRLTAVLACLVVLATACGGDDGFTYVSSTDRKAYFKVPAGWTFFDKRDILVASGQSLSEETDTSLPWLIGYDAAPDPSIDNVLDLNMIPQHPVVLARAEVLNFYARDSVSLNALRNLYYNVDQLLNEGRAEMIARHEDIVLPGGLHGSRYVYELHVQGVTGVVAGGKVLHVDQTGILDAATNTMYFFVIRCESHCYRDNKAVFDQIATSWTVKER